MATGVFEKLLSPSSKSLPATCVHSQTGRHKGGRSPCLCREYMERQRLLLFYKSNAIAKAVREFSVEGIKIDRKTVAKYCKRFKWDLPLHDLPRSVHIVLS